MKFFFEKRARFVLLVFFALSLLSGCTKKEKPPIDLTNLDLSFNPTKDFYLYVNGGWIKANPLPEDKGRFGSFDKLGDETEKKVSELVAKTAKQSHTPGSIAQKIGDFYSLGMDTKKIEEQKLSPLKKEFDRIDRITTAGDVQNEIAHLHTMGIFPLFYFRAAPDAKNSTRVIANLSQGGLGLTDRDYYTKDDPRSKEIQEAYVKYVQKIFELLGETPDNAAKISKTIMTLETQLAQASMTRLERRDPNKTYNKMKVKNLQGLSKNIFWSDYFKNIGLPEPGDLNVGQPKFFETVSSMMKTVPVEDWKTYLRWNLVNSLANYLHSDFVNAHFELYGKVLSGTEKMEPRWKRVIGTTSMAMGEALGQLYVEKYFPPEAKKRMLDLVMNLKASLGERIQNLQWMGDQTKEKALAKLATMNVKIGYPDKWRDYTALEIKRDSYAMNALRARKFEFEYSRNKIGKPVDPTEWHMPPQTVNAFYNPNLNEICFPAGILQPPFFFMNGDDAVNYGAIGVVIGHEMTHGFDDQGRQFDKEGNLKNWWTQEDAKKFKERAEVLVTQYNAFVVLDTVHADGRLSLGENISDLGGLNISYTAFQKVLKDKPASEKIDGFTPDQRFFLAYAHIWAQNIRDKEILRRTKEDVHSLGRYRVIGPLRNMPEFHAAFHVTDQDAMYLPENQRAVIW